jgi:hypothetical protein
MKNKGDKMFDSRSERTNSRNANIAAPFETLSPSDSEFLKDLRGAAIFMVVLSHMGAMWIILPYSSFIATLAPIFFFASGAGNYFSYTSSKTIFLYFLKRVNGLLVPYYLFCIVALCFFLIQNSSFPNFDFTAFLAWLVIKPAKELTPFPVVQLWFLRTLVIVIILSPLLFSVLKASRTITIIGVVLVLFLSLFQSNGLNSIAVRAMGLDLYRAMFYSAFFIAGAIYYGNKHFFTRKVHFIIFFLAMAIAILLPAYFREQTSLVYHVEVPDLYFAATSSAVLLILLMAKDFLLDIADKISGISWCLGFLNKHSLSILVLHTLAIYLSDCWLGGSFSKGSGLVYAIVKVIIALSITFVLAVPFTLLSNTVGKWLLALYNPKKQAVAS